jgi:tRNA(Ile)-lysidine synthase
MEAEGADVAATAHNADDNAETLLYNIIRGTSATGIQAIPYKRDCFVRPLLAVSRKEIEEYAKENSISYVDDSTNSSDKYIRNFIRHNIVPLCKQLNPSFLSAVTRLTDSAKADERLISSFRSDNRRRIKKLLEENGVSGVNNQTLVKIENAIKDGGTKKFTLSNGVIIQVVNGEISFDKATIENKAYQNEPLSLGENVFFDGAVTVCCEPSTENFRGIYKTFTTVGFVSDIIFNDLRVRNRISGDTVTVGGVRKSLKKELINRKIPRNMRDLLPVFCIGDKVAFAPYVGVDDEFAPKSENSVKITVKVDL